MGDVVPFRKKRRWTRPEDYGHNPEPPTPTPPRQRPPKEPRKFRKFGFRAWQFWLVAFIGVGLWVGSDPLLMEPPALLADEPEKIDGDFTRCDQGRGAFCVIDGDTFKIGERSIRLIGIDAPETHPARCEAEAKAGEAATAQLQRLLNEGPFVIVGRIDEPTDKYGRELRAAKRTAPDGSSTLIARQMIDSGTVRPYRGGLRSSWCPQRD